MNDFTQLVDLASERVGGRVLAANDEFFAPRDNLLKPAKPVWIEDKYTERGKWMDGWETRRRRTPGFDWCIMQLGIPGILRGVMVDTSYFKGNYPEQCSLEACALADGARVDEAEFRHDPLGRGPSQIGSQRRHAELLRGRRSPPLHPSAL